MDVARADPAFALAYLWHLSEYLWFIFSDGRITDGPLAMHMIEVAARPLIGPLLMHLFFITERDRLPRHRLGQATIRTSFAIAIPLAVAWPVCTLTLDMRPWIPTVKDVIHTASDLLLAGGVIFAAVSTTLASRPDDSVFRRRRRRWYLALVCTVLGSLCVQFVWWGPVQEAVLSYLPTMLFVLVTVYYGERLTFFDIFAKRGLLFFLALAVLTGYFALIYQRLAFTRLCVREAVGDGVDARPAGDRHAVDLYQTRRVDRSGVAGTQVLSDRRGHQLRRKRTGGNERGRFTGARRVQPVLHFSIEGVHRPRRNGGRYG